MANVLENFQLNYLLARAVGSTLKLGGCLFAPKSSTRIFTHDKSEQFTSVISEALGNNQPKLLCVAGVLAKDAADVGMWLYENNLLDDVVEKVTKWVDAQTGKDHNASFDTTSNNSDEGFLVSQSIDQVDMIG
jgi:hypothetical protein